MVDITFGSMTIEDQGEGPAVVMLHGLGGTSNSFQPLMPYLDGLRVLRPDLPGAGRSGYRPGIPGMPGLVTAVSDAVQAAGIQHAHFVGHSMGTLICQYLAVECPGLIASMTLLGALVEPPPPARQGLKERANVARQQGMATIADTIATGSTTESSRQRNPIIAAFVRESLMRQNPATYASHCESLSEATAASHERITCSTLLIAGQFDSIAPVKMAEELAAQISNSQLEIIADAGHWLMIEAPERTGELLRSHLNKQIEEINGCRGAKQNGRE